jgi:hypothetical protein
MDNGLAGVGQVAISTGEFPCVQTGAVAALANVAASLDFATILAALHQSHTEGDRLARRTGEPPRDGEVYQAVYCVPVRWKAYSPKSEQFRMGIKGRWQQMTEYGGWENSPGGRQAMPFTEWYPDFDAHLSSKDGA